MSYNDSGAYNDEPAYAGAAARTPEAGLLTEGDWLYLDANTGFDFAEQTGDWLHLNANTGFEFEQTGDWLYANGVPGIEMFPSTDGVASIYENVGIPFVVTPDGVAWIYENVGWSLVGPIVVGEFRDHEARRHLEAEAEIYEDVT